MMKFWNLKTRRILLVVSFFVFLLSLTSCRTAGDLAGNLDVKAEYVKAGEVTVYKGELWNELKWSAHEEIESKFETVVVREYLDKVSLVVDKTYATLSAEEKATFKDEAEYNNLVKQYTERLTAYVIQDVYNFSFSTKSVAELEKEIEALKHYDKEKLLYTYDDEIFTNYNDEKIGELTIKQACEKGQYLELAKQYKDMYYTSLAKELLAYNYLEEKIDEAFEEIDTEDEDDIGYFTKDDYTNTFKDELTNQGELNAILIRFASKDEFEDTLRSFGLIAYENRLVYIPKGDRTYSEYCDYYDDLSTADIKNSHKKLSTLDVLEVYIQMYNYLYGSYRTPITYEGQPVCNFDSVDLTEITNTIQSKNAAITGKAEEDAINNIASKLPRSTDKFVVDTYFTRDDIDTISASFNTYLYETLTLPLKGKADEDKICYSTTSQNYNEGEWIAFKLTEGEDKYQSLYDEDTTDDELYDIIAGNEEIKNTIEVFLKRNKITDSLIKEAIDEEKKDVKVKIYDEAIEISYAVNNEGYSKTYGKAPNENVAAVLEYNDKKYNINIVADANDANALNGGLFDTLEVKKGVTTAIDILSKKVVKQSKAWEETAKDQKEFEDNLKYLLIAFTNDYYSSNGYPSSIGKYNFMMLYFHTADVKTIIEDFYRVNAASSSLLTNYNSPELLKFFANYSNRIYDNYFSIGGKRLVVYVDANDDNQRDEVSTWNENQVTAAKKLVEKVYAEVSSLSGSHATTLETLVKEFNTSARALYTDNPIAPEQDWAEYRKLGLNLALEDVNATNETTDIDFALKEELYEIWKSDFTVNKDVPTEYLKNPTNEVLETTDGFNLILVNSAGFSQSAKFTKEQDELNVFESVDVYYNDEYITINNVYNENDKLTEEQIKLYVLEYITSGTSNLSASAISTALQNLIAPIVTRFTSNETQREILVYYITNTAGKIEFVGSNAERFQKINTINQATADGYLDMYFEEDKTNTLKTYENWWSEIQNIVKEILSEGDVE